jgi:hypothetical protein
LFFIRDNQDIFSFSIETQRQQQQQHDNNKDSDTIFSVNNWSYSNDMPIVRNAVYCFDLIWEEKENHDKTIKEKRHSELLFDLISHDIGNYHQAIDGSLDIITSLIKKITTMIITQMLSPKIMKEFFYFLQLQKKH